MSSASFSHQFYQRWALVPDPIRAAIVQELTDIDALLQPETPPEQFVFSKPNLDTYLDTLYDTHAEDDANKNSAQATTEVTEHFASIEPKTDHPQQHSVTHTETKNSNQTNNNTDKADPSDRNHTDSSDAITDINTSDFQKVGIEDRKLESHPSENLESDKVAGSNGKDDTDAQADAESSPNTMPSSERMPKTPKLIQDNEDLIHELGMHIDDYLSDQMTQLSEDLKSWLREEISRQLNDKV